MSRCKHTSGGSQVLAYFNATFQHLEPQNSLLRQPSLLPQPAQASFQASALKANRKGQHVYPRPAICRGSSFDASVLSCLLDVGGSQGVKRK